MAAMLRHVPSLQGNMTWYRCPRKLEGHMEKVTQKNKSNFGLAYDCSTILDQRVLADTMYACAPPSKSNVLHRRKQERKSENGKETFVCRMRTEEARRNYAYMYYRHLPLIRPSFINLRKVSTLVLYHLWSQRNFETLDVFMM